MKTCQSCGTIHATDSRFCSHCGQVIQAKSSGFTSAFPSFQSDPALSHVGLKSELSAFLHLHTISEDQAPFLIHLLGQNYTLPHSDALRTLLQKSWVRPDTPVYLRSRQRWYEASKIPPMLDDLDPKTSTSPIPEEKTNPLSSNQETAISSASSPPSSSAAPLTKADMVLSARLGQEAEEAATRRDYDRAIEIYQQVVQLNPRYPLVQKRLRELTDLAKTYPKRPTKPAPAPPAFEHQAARPPRTPASAAPSGLSASSPSSPPATPPPHPSLIPPPPVSPTSLTKEEEKTALLSQDDEIPEATKTELLFEDVPPPPPPASKPLTFEDAPTKTRPIPEYLPLHLGGHPARTQARTEQRLVAVPTPADLLAPFSEGSTFEEPSPFRAMPATSHVLPAASQALAPPSISSPPFALPPPSPQVEMPSPSELVLSIGPWFCVIFASPPQISVFSVPNLRYLASAALRAPACRFLHLQERLAILLPSLNQVLFLHLPTLRPLGSVEVGKRPSDLAVMQDGLLLVVSTDEGSVSIVDPLGFSEKKRIYVGGQPVKIIPHPSFWIFLHQNQRSLTFWTLPT